jgi:hypothetical protein
VIQIVWEFRVAAGKEADFERHYGPEGTWVQLFRKAAAFIGTELLRDLDVAGRYLTIDRWEDLKSYDLFRDRFADEYSRIDHLLEALTQAETKLGIFDTV